MSDTNTKLEDYQAMRKALVAFSESITQNATKLYQLSQSIEQGLGSSDASYGKINNLVGKINVALHKCAKKANDIADSFTPIINSLIELQELENRN